VSTAHKSVLLNSIANAQ